MFEFEPEIIPVEGLAAEEAAAAAASVGVVQEPTRKQTMGRWRRLVAEVAGQVETPDAHPEPITSRIDSVDVASAGPAAPIIVAEAVREVADEPAIAVADVEPDIEVEPETPAISRRQRRRDAKAAQIATNEVATRGRSRRTDRRDRPRTRGHNRAAERRHRRRARHRSRAGCTRDLSPATPPRREDRAARRQRRRDRARADRRRDRHHRDLRRDRRCSGTDLDADHESLASLGCGGRRRGRDHGPRAGADRRRDRHARRG